MVRMARLGAMREQRIDGRAGAPGTVWGLVILIRVVFLSTTTTAATVGMASAVLGSSGSSARGIANRG